MSQATQIVQATISDITPVPQGSLSSGARGQQYYTNAARLKPYRHRVAKVVSDALPQNYEVTNGAVGLSVVFVFRKPTTTKYPHHKVTVPDLDKLLRAVLDSLTGVVYKDDCQVTRIVSEKCWDDKYPELHVDEGVILRAYRL